MVTYPDTAQRTLFASRGSYRHPEPAKTMQAIDSRPPDLPPGQAYTGTNDSSAHTSGAAAGGLSSLTDMAEEISLHMAHKTEEKHHAERKVKADRPGTLVSAQAIIEFFEQSRNDESQEKLQAFAKKLLGSYGAPRQAAGQAFKDTTQQYLALQYALHQGEQHGAASEILDDLHETLLDLEAEHGPEIRATLNSMGAASAYGTDAEDVLQFQQTYRDTVLGETSLAETLNQVLIRFPEANLGHGLNQLIRALGDDVTAARPSTAPERLHALLRDLHQLETAVTVLESCHTLAEGLAIPTAQHVGLMRDLVTISGEKWTTASRFETLCQKFGIGDVAPRIAMLSGLRTILRELPVPIFPDTDTRQATLDAAQEALDQAIDQEDA